MSHIAKSVTPGILLKTKADSAGGPMEKYAMVALLCIVNVSVLVLFFLQMTSSPDPDVYKRITESKARLIPTLTPTS